MGRVDNIAIACFVLITLPYEISCQCSGSSDIGNTECVLLTPYYSQYQWATCLTHEYVHRASNQRHICRNYATRCWYQCQLEINNEENGPVFDNCACSSGDTIPPSDDTMPTLDPECFSPSGDDCNWYRDCLEERYQCEATGDGYAIEYAKKFCDLFMEGSSDFSSQGMMWIDGVRKCLQVVLVPSLRPFLSKTCADIKQEAFDSHSRCYLEPGSGVPSICDLSISDKLAAFCTVNCISGSRAFTMEPIETGRQMLEVIHGCAARGIMFYGNKVAALSLFLKSKIVDNTVLTAAKITSYIANKLQFDEKAIGWFPFVDRSEDDMNQRKRRDVKTQNSDNPIVLLLFSLASLNISTNQVDNAYSIDQIVSEIANAVQNGLLSSIPVAVNDTQTFYGVSSLGQCEDVLCSNGTNVTILATSGANVSRHFKMSMVVFSVYTLLVCLFLK